MRNGRKTCSSAVRSTPGVRWPPSPHDPKIDDFPLKAALEAGCFYVGALGSRKTHAKRLERLAEQGVAPTLLERIRAPIGLPIGAASPAEIAVATLAEIIGALRGRETSQARPRDRTA